ncbi:MAG TPA: FAD-dependent monooxygenase [Candidatus Dormibacteraeota bacterium]|nr:FAD-dependent monooxygenase [Candidatus Dormibacteraeota bacterium]
MDAQVAVVGGGPVGSTMGLLLPGAVVLDGAVFPRDKPCGEGLMPAGAEVLRRAGCDLEGQGFPQIRGVRYRLPGGEYARSDFGNGVGYGTRRTRLDDLLASRAGVKTGIRVTGLRSIAGGVELETTAGRMSTATLIGADGMRSSISRMMGWERPSRRAARYALVGHLRAASPSSDVEVTLLGDVESYLAPVGEEELLFAVLGGRGRLRQPGIGVLESYQRILSRAHPSLVDSPVLGRLTGAGPFRHRPATVAQGRVFLVGDAAGFLDPLTGEGLTAGLQQAAELATLLLADPKTAAAHYRRFWRAQWRRRRTVAWMARTISGSPVLGQRAVLGMRRRPEALQSLLSMDQGLCGLAALPRRDWLALVGVAS